MNVFNETVFLGGCPVIRPEGIYLDGHQVIRLGLQGVEVGMVNPASRNCTEKGGTVQIVETPAGQSGICVFPNGSRCEEWALLRGECKPGGPSTAVGLVVGVAIGTVIACTVAFVATRKRR